MEQFFIASHKDFQHQWDGYTLVLPCVSVGNVSQLAVDLLVNSLLKTQTVSAEKDLELVGYIRSRNVHPFAGPDPFALRGPLLATSIQVFASNAKKLVVIQQRSPIYKDFRNDFYAELSQWISKHNFGLILLLSSSFDHYLSPDTKNQSQGLGQFPMQYIAPNIDETLKSTLEDKLGVTAVQRVDPFTMKADPSGRVHLPGSGSARAYLKSFSTALKNSPETKLVCLVMFCSEGDNRQHAFKLADKVAHLVNRNEVVLNLSAPSKLASDAAVQSEFDWSIPFSWRTLFGEEPPANIF